MAQARIGAVHISVYGWSARVLRGLRPVLEVHKPRKLLVEWHPVDSADPAKPQELLPLMLEWLFVSFTSEASLCINWWICRLTM